MTTTPEQIESMRVLVDTLIQEPLVRHAVLDDWGRYGNFQIVVYPQSPDRHTTNRLRGVMNRLLKGHEAHLRTIFGPDPVKQRVYSPSSGRMEERVVGHQRDYWIVDVDYAEYLPDSNTFA